MRPRWQSSAMALRSIFTLDRSHRLQRGMDKDRTSSGGREQTPADGAHRVTGVRRNRDGHCADGVEDSAGCDFTCCHWNYR